MQDNIVQLTLGMSFATDQLNAARRRTAASEIAWQAAIQRAQMAQVSLTAFDDEFFTPESWGKMADLMRDISRSYLFRAIRIAKLMERAYNFENDTQLKIIKSEYGHNVGNSAGGSDTQLLGGNSLLQDIDAFTFNAITTKTRKSSRVKDVISLSSNFPAQFEEFRDTGLLSFETDLYEFDRLHPGFYSQRIEAVEVEIIGLLPEGGLNGTLMAGGVSRFRKKDATSDKRVHQVDTMALSDFVLRNDIFIYGVETGVRGLFQGLGVGCTWQLHLPKRSNDFDFRRIFDVHLVLYYTAKFDPLLRTTVLTAPLRPGEMDLIRNYGIRYDFPDAWYAFYRTGITEFTLDRFKLPFNQRNFKTKAVQFRVVTKPNISNADIDLRVTGPDQLPFVVQVVRAIREIDTITGRTNEMNIHYHDGVYDGPEREYRGFTQVTVDMPGDESVPTSRQEFEFFQGDPELVDLAERERQRSLSGSVLVIKILEQVGDQYRLCQESRQTWETRLEHDDGNGRVYFPFVSLLETIEHSPGLSPQRVERTRLLNYNEHGLPERRVRESFAEGAPVNERIRTLEHYTYTNNESDWLIKLPVRLELRDSNDLPFAVKVTYYDGPAFVGLAEGEVDSGLPSRVVELKLLESRLPTDYLGDRDFAALGYELTGTGVTRGYYATTLAVRRDGKGNVVEQRNPLGRPLNISFDAEGVYPIKSTDARGKETFFTFNPKAGEPSRVSFPDGRIIRYEYDAIGRLAASFETDDSGSEQLVKCWVVDVESNPASLTSIAPNSSGRTRAELVSVTDFAMLDDVSVSRIYYDGFGKQILQISTAPDTPGGERRFVTSGQVRLNPRALASVQYPPGFVPTLALIPEPAPSAASALSQYDVMGNLKEIQGPGQVHFRVVRDTFTIHHYEGVGAGASGTPVPPGPPTRVEHFDARGRLFRIEEAKGDGTFVSAHYDLAVDGRIQIIRDNAGQEMVRYTLVGSSEPIIIAHRDIGARTYYRDATGQVVERIDPDGSALFYTYDVLGRLTRVEHTATGSTVKQLVRELIYDSDPAQPSDGRFLDGRVALIREAGNEIRYSYSRSGKTLREEVTASGVTLTTGREFDLQGRITTIIYPDAHKVNYTLDASGAVKEIAGVVSNISYAADGIIEAYRLANGIEVAMPRDAVSRRLNEVSARKDADLLRRLGYTYDTVGNIIGLRDEDTGNIEHQRFAYDGLYRLSEFKVRANDAEGAVLRNGIYDYDAEGNIRQFQETDSLTLNYADTLRPGRLTAVTRGTDERAIGYNARGQINAFGDLTAIEYDPFDRVTRVSKTDGTEVRIAYDPQSRRILKEVTQNAVTTRIHYVTGLYEQRQTDAIRNIYLGILLVASEKVPLDEPESVATVYYLSDHHGTILMATDATGAIIHNQRYSPFGAALNTSTTLDRYLGRERDVETGLLHLGARYYAPAIGRFISPDWYVLETPTKPMRMPQGYNVYSYALNNPLVFKDPSGLWFGIDDLIVAAVGFVVGFVSGLVYGLANGQGWGSFLTALETGLTTAAGAWLGWNVGFLIGGPILGVVGAVMGGMNGLVSGIHGIYDWSSIDGWFAFLSDSTWGLIGTSLGNIVHVINLFGSTGYREDLSRRQNRHVYEGGFYLKDGFAFTMGNVISNAGQNGKGINTSFIANHEELHIWQNRFFGPLFQATYIGWAVGGFLVGTVVWFFNTDQDYGSIIETAAYYDNPFEYWAYKNDNNWPPGGANPVIAWG